MTEEQKRSQREWQDFLDRTRYLTGEPAAAEQAEQTAAKKAAREAQELQTGLTKMRADNAFGRPTGTWSKEDVQAVRDQILNVLRSMGQ